MRCVLQRSLINANATHQELPPSANRGPERVSVFPWGEGVADARSAGFYSSPLTEFRMHQHARRPHINPVIPRPRFECRPVDTSVWRGPIGGWHGRCMSVSTASSERSCRLGTLWPSFFMRSRQRTREDGKSFTNYLTWHTGGRERESLGLARYVDERECTHYCALAPDNVPGPSCWGSTGRDIYRRHPHVTPVWKSNRVIFSLSLEPSNVNCRYSDFGPLRILSLQA